MLEKEFEYYLDHQDELVKKYSGKYLVIIGEEVVNSFDTMEDAYEWSSGKYELGTFLIQYCAPGKDNYTQTFHTRVRFA